jgi:hypothetical protein
MKEVPVDALKESATTDKASGMRRVPDRSLMKRIVEFLLKPCGSSYHNRAHVLPVFSPRGPDSKEVSYRREKSMTARGRIY